MLHNSRGFTISAAQQWCRHVAVKRQRPGSARPDRRQVGFTIVELLVTMVVTGIMVAGITQLYIVIEQTQQQSERLESATRAGQQEIESLRNLRYGSLTAGSTIDFTSQLPSDLPSPRTATVAISEPTTDIKRVDVTINYRESGKTKAVKLSSLIGVLGIGQ